MRLRRVGVLTGILCICIIVVRYWYAHCEDDSEFNRCLNNDVKKGRLTGGVVHDVCIYDTFVVKRVKTCSKRDNIKDVLGDHVNYFFQTIAHHRLMSLYKNVPAILTPFKHEDGLWYYPKANVSIMGGNLTELNVAAMKNGDLFLDLNYGTNILKYEKNWLIIDSNMRPEFVRWFVDRYVEEKKLPGHDNLYGDGKTIKMMS